MIHKVVLDFETFYGKDYSLSGKGWTTESYIRADQFKVHGCGVKIGDKDSIWVTANKLPALFSRMPWDKVAMIGHNLQFDGTILAWKYGYVPRLYIDTLGMSRALVGQHSARHGLDALGQLLLGAGKIEGLKLTYGIRDLEPWLEHKLGVYCQDDCDKTWRLFKMFAPHFPKKEFLALDWTIRKFTQPKLFFDEDMLRAYYKEVLDGKEEALRRCGMTDRKILMSADKYAAALIELGVVPPVKINPKGEIKYAFAKTDHEHKALLEHDSPEVQALVAARMEVKTTIEETRTLAYLGVAERGAWPLAYSYSGAVNTQRDSGNKGGGGNPMNLKRGGTLRKAINAPYGYKLLVFDLSQIECRMTLWYGMLSRYSKGLEAEALALMAQGDVHKRRMNDYLRQGNIAAAKAEEILADKCDIYSYFAAMMFGREILKGRDKNERQIGKSAVLGLGFGMGAGRFMDYSITMGAKGVDATLAESTVYLYRNTYVGVKSMWRSLEAGFKNAVQQVKEINENIQQGIPHSEFKGWTFGPTRILRDPLFNSISMQTGEDNLLVKYPDLSWDAEGEGTYRDGNHRVKIFGGKFMENLIQNAARNVLVDKKMEIQKRYEVVMSTYDEIVMLVPEDEIDTAIDFAMPIMTADHPLFPGLPIGADYGHHQSYGSAKD